MRALVRIQPRASIFKKLKLKKRKWAEPMREGCSPGIIRTCIYVLCRKVNTICEKSILPFIRFVRGVYRSIPRLLGRALERISNRNVDLVK